MLSAFGFPQETEIETAKELIEALSLINIEWADTGDKDIQWGRRWLFRGQSNSTWRVQASALRDKNLEILKGILGLNYGEHLRRIASEIIHVNHAEIIGNVPRLAEIENSRVRVIDVICNAFLALEAVNQFIYTTDSIGHESPGIENILSNYQRDLMTEYTCSLFGLKNQTRKLEDFWLKREIAFAQHHGIPTRLLDWSENPLAALFFAAEDAIKNSTNTLENIVIYAINTSCLDIQEKLVVQVPLSQYENTYLRVQKGVLITDLSADMAYIETGIYPDIFTSLSKLRKIPSEPYMPRKFIIPTSEAPELLRLLSILGITKASLMPSADNVAETLKLRWKLIRNIW